MEKVLDKYSTLFDEIFSQNENTSNPYMDFPHKNQSSLTSYILNTSGINNYGGFLGVITDEEFNEVMSYCNLITVKVYKKNEE